ncbi:MAG: ABC-ATPase domain-containing protein, partial [Peptococcaceae bacterium]|nr:ABC-ATPase domain-containing protein [Peptococcaceae bacterium]
MRRGLSAAGGHSDNRGAALWIDAGGQEILLRSAVRLAGGTEGFVEARISVALPAAGRRILGRQCQRLLTEVLPRAAREGLTWGGVDQALARRWVACCEDQEFIRAQLGERGLCAFVGDGSILPRESGVSDRPMRSPPAVRFESPKTLSVEFPTPNSGTLRGMGIPCGVTLIVGGGYHGKSTLLRALERGVYNHIPGDGRELVITVGDAVKIRAEDGRSVEKVDISAFITNLPHGQDTRAFSTENASGSTSQAANIVEALEMGTRLLLLDEDTSATNFMIRDGRMQELVTREYEPITPFIDRVRQLYEHLGVSTILVVGGSGDYFAVADRVIMMQNYIPRDVTQRAREIALRHRDGRRVEAVGTFSRVTPRIPLPASFTLEGRGKVKARGTDEIVYGYMDIDLQDVEQLVDPAQLRAIAEIIKYAAKHYINGERTLREVVLAVLADMDKEGLDVVSPFKGQHPGDYARPRAQEIAAAINRYRRLQVRQQL